MAVDVNRSFRQPTPEEMEARRREAEARFRQMEAEFRAETVQFGPHAKHKMHIFFPKQAAGAAPLFVFLHGGGFRNGDPMFQAADGRPVLEHGGIYVTMGYRLLPETPFPDDMEDVELGLKWLHDNIASRGGDPARLFLSGHSAGACLAAMAGLRTAWTGELGLPEDLVKGLVLISGFYDFAGQQRGDYNTAHPRWVPDLTKGLDRTPPAIIVVGEQDMPACLPNGRALEAALQAKGGQVQFFIEKGANHFQANQGLISSQGAVFQATKRLMGLAG